MIGGKEEDCLCFASFVYKESAVANQQVLLRTGEKQEEEGKGGGLPRSNSGCAVVD
jgi:hypothetical protein